MLKKTSRVFSKSIYSVQKKDKAKTKLAQSFSQILCLSFCSLQCTTFKGAGVWCYKRLVTCLSWILSSLRKTTLQDLHQIWNYYHFLVNSSVNLREISQRCKERERAMEFCKQNRRCKWGCCFGLMSRTEKKWFLFLIRQASTQKWTDGFLM